MHAQDKQTHVKTWRSSGLTKADYARKSGINSKPLSRWCQQYPLEPTGKSSLAAVQSTQQSPTQTAIQLQLRSGNTLELPIDTSPRWLVELLQCLD